MGKKTAKERKEKKKAPSETNSRGEERALRKAAQYQQSKNKKEANYNEEANDSKDAKAVNCKTESSGHQPNRSNVKSCNSNSTITPQASHGDLKNNQNNTQNNTKVEKTVGNFRSVCVSENMEKLNKKTLSKEKSQCDINITNLSPPPADSHVKIAKSIPRPPKFDPRRMQRLVEMRKSSRESSKNQEADSNADCFDKSLIADITIPPQGSSPTEVTAAIELLKKRNTEIQEKLTSTRESLQASLENVIKDEYMCNKQLMMMKIARQELIEVNSGDPGLFPAKLQPVQNDHLPIPTKDAYMESRKILKRFIEIRNKRLLSCVSIEITLNTIGDNYTNLLYRHRENSTLVDCIVSQKQEKKIIGSQILIMSTKLLEKIQQQLRKHDNACFSNHHNSSSKSWSRKIRNYDNTMLNLKNTLKNMKNCIGEKEKTLKIIEEEAQKLNIDKTTVSKELNEVEKSFELSVSSSKCYVDTIKIGKNIKKNIAKVKEKNDKITELMNSIRSKMKLVEDEASKNDDIYNKVYQFKDSVITTITSWERKRKVHEAARKMLHSLRMRILHEEEYQSELKNKIEYCKRTYAPCRNELEVNLCKHKKNSRKLRFFTRQMNNFTYKNCKEVIQNYARNANIGITC